MTNKSSTFRRQIFPTPLETQQRSYHRLRSSRKLEAVRGITPLFLDLHSKADIISDTPSISPRTRARRRKGLLFNSPSSPIISSSTDSSIESDYVFVNARVLSDFKLHSPSSSRTPSPARKYVSNGNRNLGITANKAKSGDGNKTKDTEGPQPLAQPFLLHLRSLPVPTATSINSNDRRAHHPEQQQPPSQSLTSMSSSFNISHSCHGRVLTESELKRLAKVARTLGENIPPELVFHASPPPVQRATPMPSSRTRQRYHKPSPSLAVPSSLPPPPSSAPALPPFPPPQQQQPVEFHPPVKPRSMARPRSMTLTTTSPIMAAPSIRGASLDGFPVNPPFQEIIVTAPEPTDLSPCLDWHKRKGHGWSGEWNRDMEHVAKALRDLKAR